MTRCMFHQMLWKGWKRTVNWKKEVYIILAKTNIRKQVGGSLLTANLSLGRAFAPTLGKTLGLSALVGLTNVGTGQLDKKISGG